MIIYKIAIGNNEEAFIHTSFCDNKVNIISSDDNNRGKTILIQSLMYCLGNTPIFPSSFNYKNYYYIIEFSVKDKYYILCRRKETFILRQGTSLMIFNNTSELKRYWSKNIFDLPIIKKNGIQRIVDPELFVQLFFVGQDKKDTSNIANKGFYNKEDFNNMIYAIKGLGAEQVSHDEISSIKMKLQELKEERTLLLREHKILKSPKKAVYYLSAISDKIAFESQIKEIEKIKEEIANLRVARNTAVNRKLKCEITLKELNSLNRSMDQGELRCMDCNSTHIVFKTESKAKCTFDITTSEVRHEIIESINNKIIDYMETIEIITSEINASQAQLQALLDDENITLESIVAYKQDILNAVTAEKRVLEIDAKIKKLTESLVEKGANVLADKQALLRADIIETMNKVYKEIDPTGNLSFDDLFTTKDKVYSGSEATIFHLVKLLALAKVLKHNYPIIVDSFRAEDLSTSKENKVIELFNQLGKQIIFTTTLKQEEHRKYDSIDDVYHIDFTSHDPSKMLNSSFVGEFLDMAAQLALSV
jgi:hypothetical protein